jgi:hypothetical protein
LVPIFCVSQLSITVTNACDNQLIKRKDLFWLIVLEVFVHDWLVQLLLGYDKAANPSKDCMVEHCCSPHDQYVKLMVEGIGISLSPSSGCPQ